MANLGDFMAEYEAELLAKGRAEIAAEDAAYAALTPEEKAAKAKAYEDKWGAFEDAANAQEADPDEDDEEEEIDDDEG